MSGKATNVRWREDVGWEMRCDDCKANGHSACYWPLEPAGMFWGKRSQARCVSCERIRENRRDRRARALRADVRGNQRAAAKRRYYLHRDEILEGIRAKYWANRDEILAKRRAKAAAEREAEGRQRYERRAA